MSMSIEEIQDVALFKRVFLTLVSKGERNSTFEHLLHLSAGVPKARNKLSLTFHPDKIKAFNGELQLSDAEITRIGTIINGCHGRQPLELSIIQQILNYRKEWLDEI